MTFRKAIRMRPAHVILAAGMFAATLAAAQTGLRIPEVQTRATIGVLNLQNITVDEPPRPAKPAPEGKYVKVLKIGLTFEAGEVTGAEVLESRRVNSIAPKVFLRKFGDWRVTIGGEAERSFLVSHPGRGEVEVVGDPDKVYEWVEESGTIEWPLVVPLYAGGASFDAESITIQDVKTRKVILEADLY